MNNGAFGAGWLDVGIEYLQTRRDMYGGAAEAGPAGPGTASPTASCSG